MAAGGEMQQLQLPVPLINIYLDEGAGPLSDTHSTAPLVWQTVTRLGDFLPLQFETRFNKNEPVQ